MRREEILSYLRTLKASLPGSPLLEIGLFGSQARQTADITSDIDLFVHFDPKYLQSHDAWAYFDILNEIKERTKRHFKHPVDIVDKESANSFLKQVIAKEGIGV